MRPIPYKYTVSGLVREEATAGRWLSAGHRRGNAGKMPAAPSGDRPRFPAETVVCPPTTRKPAMPAIAFDRFCRYAELTAILQAFAAEHPRLVSIESIGKSH